MITLSRIEQLEQLKERYAALLARREVLNTELLALKLQIDALMSQVAHEQAGLPENARLLVTLDFVNWVNTVDAPCRFVEGEAVLQTLYRHPNGEVVGQVYQAASATGMGRIPLALILQMRATWEQGQG
jgi:hypothetical protein